MRRTNEKTDCVRLSIALFAAISLLGAASCTRRPGPLTGSLSGDHVRARLVADAERLIPGTAHLIGVLFEMDLGWHLYAPARNDSGLPIVIRAAAPAGYSLGEVLWPAPQRHVSEGAVLDHVYLDRVVLLIPLEVPAEARPGQRVTVRCRAEWLVCGTGCIPGEGSLDLTMTVGDRDDAFRPSADAARILEALQRVPLPLPASAESAVAGVTRAESSAATLARDRVPPALLQGWSGDSWIVQVRDATALAFYPDERSAPLARPIEDAVSGNGRLRLNLAPDVPDTSRIVGILEASTAQGSVFRRLDSGARAGVEPAAGRDAGPEAGR